MRGNCGTLFAECAMVITDCFGRAVRLTEERLGHILQHPEKKEMTAEIERALREPELVRQSRSDAEAHLFYRYYAHTLVGGK